MALMDEGDCEPDPTSLIECLPDAVLFTDLEARLVWGNRAAEELFGRTLEESAGMVCMDLIHPDDLEMAVVSLASMQSERVGLPLELRVRTPSGWRQVELIGSNVDGGLLMVIRDLTQRRRWDVAHDRTDLFRSVLQHLSSVVMVLEPSGEMRATSAALTRLLGIGQRVVEGRHVTMLVSSPDRPLVTDALRRTLDADSGAKFDIDVDGLRADGSIQPVSISMVNLVDDPTVAGIVVTISDNTRRARAEHGLRSANAVLAATLDSVSDGILALDGHGAVCSWNRQFVDIWGIPEEHLRRDDLRAILDHTVALAAEPDEVRRAILEVHRDGSTLHGSTIELVDGRVIECRSRPQRVDGVASGRVWSFRDVTSTRELERDLEHRALHDPLTGLANQVLFRRELERVLVEVDDRPCAVAFVDLDGFKEVNDSLGHSAGDLLLVEVARRLRSVLRPVDTVARLGGDEFAMLLVDVDGDEVAVDVARRLQERLGDPIDLLGHSVVPGASIGIAISQPGAEVDGLLRDADLAMYHAKRSGRNQYRLFTPELAGTSMGSTAIDPRLRGAAARGELIVHYQPIVDPKRGNEIVAAEALVRWRHPERGIVGPAEFVPYAERSGLIDEIGLHVLELACRDVLTWSTLLGVRAPLVSVNLSPHQVLDERLPDRVMEVISGTGADPSRVVLEFTEGALMQDPATVARQLHRIRDTGIRLAVDDFGTGHSSLARLQQFPISTLKIDRTFVQQVEGRTGASLVLAVVQLAHALEMLAVAEGVETAEQQDRLNDLGVDLAQGYLHHRPLEPDAVTALLAGSAVTTAPLR